MFGDISLISLAEKERAQVTMKPARQVDRGEGKGTPVTREARGGAVGLMLDGRGRPLQLPVDARTRVAALTRWHQAVGLYPK